MNIIEIEDSYEESFIHEQPNKNEKDLLKDPKKVNETKSKSKEITVDLRDEIDKDNFIILGKDDIEHEEKNILEEDLALYEQIVEDSDIEIIENPSSNKEEHQRLRKEQEFANETPLCIICYGEPINAVVTECGHVYCCECLHEYRNKNFTTCAVCRKHYNDRNNQLIIMKAILIPK
ncbi:hypothetical protein QEN19_003296 [Hanseniaspora menglaensis]